GRGVLHLVPALPLLYVAQPKIGRQVHDADTAIQDCPRLVHGHAARRGEEHHVTAAHGLRARLAERELDAAAQARKHRRDRRTGFSVASYSINAREMPCRTAPAWPLSPPPYTFTRMSKLARLLVRSSGWRTTMRPVSRPKNSSTGLPLTTNWPLPGLRKTRAT